MKINWINLLITVVSIVLIYWVLKKKTKFVPIDYVNILGLVVIIYYFVEKVIIKNVEKFDSEQEENNSMPSQEMIMTSQEMMNDPNLMSGQEMMNDPNMMSGEEMMNDPNMMSGQEMMNDPNMMSGQEMMMPGQEMMNDGMMPGQEMMNDQGIMASEESQLPLMSSNFDTNDEVTMEENGVIPIIDNSMNEDIENVDEIEPEVINQGTAQDQTTTLNMPSGNNFTTDDTKVTMPSGKNPTSDIMPTASSKSQESGIDSMEFTNKPQQGNERNESSTSKRNVNLRVSDDAVAGKKLESKHNTYKDFNINISYKNDNSEIKNTSLAGDSSGGVSKGRYNVNDSGVNRSQATNKAARRPNLNSIVLDGGISGTNNSNASHSNSGNGNYNRMCKPQKMGFSDYGWSYMPPASWSVPQRRPPVCTTKQTAFQPVFTDDTYKYLDSGSWNNLMPKLNDDQVFDEEYYYPGWTTYPNNTPQSTQGDSRRNKTWLPIDEKICNDKCIKEKKICNDSGKCDEYEKCYLDCANK